MIKKSLELITGSDVKPSMKIEGIARVFSAAIDGIYKRLEKVELLSQIESRIASARGENGEKGEKGEQGERGNDGEPGRDGKDGKDGKNGKDGVNGKDGRDGANGKDGKDGKQGKTGNDGVGVIDAEIAVDDHLVLKLSNGDIIDAGELPKRESGGFGGVHVAGNAYQITVAATAPANPQLNDLWFDIS
jgi:hypothetical protein